VTSQVVMNQEFKTRKSNKIGQFSVFKKLDSQKPLMIASLHPTIYCFKEQNIHSMRYQAKKNVRTPYYQSLY
jgi:hypothetical protein